MARKAAYVVPYRRKREGKTDYKGRMNLLKSETTRLVVRPSNKHMTVQLIDYRKEGDLVVSMAHSKELMALGWNYSTSNLPAAYLTGLLCGLRGTKKGVKTAILDIGLFPSIAGSKTYAALKGAIDAGLKIPANEIVFPNEKRISGEHITQKGKEKLTEEFAKVKDRILETGKK
jgi:large subunit ribosomal protein L18